MSGRLRTPEASIPGWGGPFYPPGIEELADSLGQMTYTGQELKYYAQPDPTFLGREAPVTAADGYAWFWLLAYTTPAGRYRVAIPRVHGSDLPGRRILDRSPAVYAIGYDEQSAEEIVRGLVHNMRTMEPKRYGR